MDEVFSSYKKQKINENLKEFEKKKTKTKKNFP